MKNGTTNTFSTNSVLTNPLSGYLEYLFEWEVIVCDLFRRVIQYNHVSVSMCIQVNRLVPEPTLLTKPGKHR